MDILLILSLVLSGRKEYVLSLVSFIKQSYQVFISGVSVQRNGSLFGNHVNHIGGDQQGSSHPTTVTQRPLQILPFSSAASTEPPQIVRRASSNDREGETELNSSPILCNQLHHTTHYPHCNSTCVQSPIPSNANLNNANVPSLLSMTIARQQKCLIRSRPSSTRNASSTTTYSKGLQGKPWKSHSTRLVEGHISAVLKSTVSMHICCMVLFFV